MFFKTKKIEYTYNHLSDDNGSNSIFDITFSEGEFIAKEVVRCTMLYIKLNKKAPQFTLIKEGLLERFYALTREKDIDIPNQREFSKQFYLKGDNQKEIQSFFNEDIVRFFESNTYYHVESNKEALLVFDKERIAGVKEIKLLLDFGSRLKAKIES